MLSEEDVELEIDPDPALEREAEETAQRVMVGGELGIRQLGETAVHVQRVDETRREVLWGTVSAEEVAVGVCKPREVRVGECTARLDPHRSQRRRGHSDPLSRRHLSLQ